MTRNDATLDFFRALGERGHEPLLAKATGTIRFDLEVGDGQERWLVAIDKGEVAVSNDGGEADLVVRAPRTLFDRLASGEANPMAALLRGAVELEGDPQLMLSFQRLFPGPQRATVHG